MILIKVMETIRNNAKKFKAALIAVAAICIIAYGVHLGKKVHDTIYSWFHHGQLPPVATSTTNTTHLTPGTHAQVTVSPNGNVNVTTPNGTTVLNGGDHGTTVVVDDHGNVTVKVKKFGVDIHPHFGAAASDRLQLYAGISTLYYKHYALNVGLSGSPSMDVRLRGVLSLSYNFYSNSHVFAGVNTAKYPVVGFYVRF